jgi:putative endonuclease
MPGWVYMMTNRRNGTLYTDVTDDIARRAWEYRAGLVAGFTSKYGLKILVYIEKHDDMRTARQREQNIKHCPRAWKVRLIHAQNPDWEDLYDRLS